MNRNSKFSHLWLAVSLMALALGASPLPVMASQAAAEAPALLLPPLPEWPIIGPVLQWLGVTAEEEETPAPTPGLTEYRITNFEDAQALEDIETGERVRIIASEDDLNAMIVEAIEASAEGNATVVVDLEPNLLSFDMWADKSLLEEMADSMPRRIQGDMELNGSLGLVAEECAPQVSVKTMRFNGWSFGLRPVAQRAINTRIPDIWPQEICVEQVLLMQDEVAVEGYRR